MFFTNLVVTHEGEDGRKKEARQIKLQVINYHRLNLGSGKEFHAREQRAQKRPRAN